MSRNEKGDDVRFHVNVERVTCVQSQQERVVISCNLRADLSVDAIAGMIEKMGDAALKRVEQLNKRWDSVAAESMERKSRLAVKVEHLEELERAITEAAGELARAESGELEEQTARGFALEMLRRAMPPPDPAAAAPAEG